MRDISSNYTFSLIPIPSVQCACTVSKVWERDYYSLYVSPTSMEWHWSLYVETTHGDSWNLVTMLWPMGLQKLLQSYYIERTASLLLLLNTELCYSLCASWNIQLAVITAGACLVYLVRSISLLQCSIRLFNSFLLFSQSVNGWIQTTRDASYSSYPTGYEWHSSRKELQVRSNFGLWLQFTIVVVW